MLETDGDDRVTIVRELDEPEDVSGTNPGVAVSSETTTELLIQLFDEDGSVMAFRSEVREGLSFQRMNFGVTEFEDNVDVSAITEIQISMLAGEGVDRRIRVDDLHFVPRPDEGLVLLQLDGGYETHYTAAMDVLENHDIPATAFVAPGRLRGDEAAEGDRLTEDQLSELEDSGWTVASHTQYGLDLSDMSDDEQTEAFADAVDWLEDNGYEDGARYVSYPTGRYNELSLDLATEHHQLGFAGRNSVGAYVTNPLLCPRVTDPSAEEAERILSRTAELGGVTAITYVQLGAESREAFESAAETIAELEADGELRAVLPEEIKEEYLIEA